MNLDYEKWYSNHRKKVESFWKEANIDDEHKVQYLLSSLSKAIKQSDEDEIEVLVDAAYEIKPETLQIEALNELLLIDGHEKHQEITREIQLFRDPSSVKYIEKALELGFKRLAYTCSEDEVITKWFSHALADIGTPEAITIIEKYASDTNKGISSEMQYRLSKVKA
jgi:HEAT repeat protein